VGSSSDDKAARYLAEGRVKAQFVSEAAALFHVTGSEPGDPYFVKFSNSVGWRCDCPARVAECAHIKACALITSLEVTEPARPSLSAGQRDADIDALLSGGAED
jgi:uncharacterized Zn finger protein